MDEDWFTDSDVKEFFESIASVSNEDEDDATEKDAMKNGDSEKQQNKGEPELEKGMKNVTNKVNEASQIMCTWYAICSFK